MKEQISNLHLNIFEAIKSDDLVTFSALMSSENEKMFSLSFGRFPILTLCYMYGAKKIVSMYEDRLIKIGNYVITFEPFEIYESFIKIAKKGFRLYLSSDSIVYPIEMLLFTKQYDYLSSKYMLLYKNDVIKQNLEYISKNINHEKIDIDNTYCVVKNRKLKPHQKWGLVGYATISFVMIIMCIMIAVLQPMIIGSGTINHPIMIYSETQLITAMKGGKNYKLAKDITLTKKWARIPKFVGSIDGNGHTIFAYDNIIDEFVFELTGTIKNIRFDFGDSDFEVFDNKAFVVTANNTTGVIDNVDVIIKRTFTTKENLSNETSYIVSTLCLENYGTIKNCDMSIDYYYDSQGLVDVYLTGMLGINRGTGRVMDCSTTNGSKIIATQVDVAGVVGFNYTEYNFLNIYALGELSGITNNASINIVSVGDGWSPVVGGVCIENRGVATALKNNANIFVKENSYSEEKLTISIAGLIVNNYYKIQDSCNLGSITAESNVASIRIGGVVTTATRLNYQMLYTFSDISGCYSKGLIKATTVGEDNHIALGGIVAYAINSNIQNNYVTTTFESAGTDKSYVGSICGLVNDIITSSNSYGIISNNYY
ncbi:MAG: hypothetical protein IJW28_04610, partial [Clostridia bacterium]|nr:hypothetical protein [Clostridia bacterium]